MTRIAYPIRNSLYLNITDRCTLECRFCPKHTAQGPVVHDYDLTLDHRPEVDEIITSIGNPGNYEEIVFCGFGEPTLRFKVLMEVARWIKAHGGKVRINTDGLANLVNKRDVLPEMQGVVDSLSISMNAQNPDVYAQHCHPALPGSWEAMLAFLEEAPRYIPNVTATAIDGLDGVDIPACEALATERGVEFRRRQLDKVG
ncbi:TatD family nuclease-associated radical SAM protein [Thiolapillus brandeum]|uniref:Radical SAM domain protein n=1 Tax=Thiolapillus brandeum TaxID=1076588 RepID=A0A7U6GJN9_9GAMM|nr:TatD family nuclease-associated radical SAM protein [Thiolapillus brandeum]BAO44832.1 radical SAM domain protein [Thiolapillus brandeum]